MYRPAARKLNITRKPARPEVAEGAAKQLVRFMVNDTARTEGVRKIAHRFGVTIPIIFMQGVERLPTTRSRAAGGRATIVEMRVDHQSRARIGFCVGELRPRSDLSCARRRCATKQTREDVMKTLACAGALTASLLLATALSSVRAADMTFERALSATKEPHNWLLHHGNYEGWRFSQLKEINTETVKNLKPLFSVALGDEEIARSTIASPKPLGAQGRT
jgi:hypothetical protein